MNKLKLAELIVLTISALITAAKSVIKFAEYMFRIRKQTATSTA
jgi:hypothetical protein